MIQAAFRTLLVAPVGLRKWTETIRNNGAKVLAEVRTMSEALEHQVASLRETSDGLKELIGDQA